MLGALGQLCGSRLGHRVARGLEFYFVWEGGAKKTCRERLPRSLECPLRETRARGGGDGVMGY